MATLTELIGDLQAELKIDPQNRIWSLDTKISAINDAYTRVQKDWQYWRPENQFLRYINLSPAVQEYPLDYNAYDDIYTLYNWDYTYDIFWNIWQFREVVQASLIQQGTWNTQIRMSKCTKQWAIIQWTQQRWQPTCYYIWKNLIWFYQIPNMSYTVVLLYNSKLPKISYTQDSLYPEEFNRAIVLYAAYMLNMQPWGREQIATYKYKEYEDMMDTLRLTFLYRDLNWTFAYQRAWNMLAPYWAWNSIYNGIGTSFNANI